MHLTDLLSILLNCNGFTGTQKSAVGQMGSRPPNSDHDFFLDASLALGSGSEFLLGPTTELIISGCIKYTFLHVTIPLRSSPMLLHRVNEDNSSKQQLFLIFGQLMRHPLFDFSPFQFASNAE